MSDAILQVHKLEKHFGGLAAVDSVSLDVRAGALHAVIGPNGAGKTTLINMLSGDLMPSAGSIVYRGAIRELIFLPALVLKRIAALPRKHASSAR